METHHTIFLVHAVPNVHHGRVHNDSFVRATYIYTHYNTSIYYNAQRCPQKELCDFIHFIRKGNFVI